MIIKETDGNKVIRLELPETRIQLNNDGDLVVRQLNWNVLEEQWEENTVCIPKDFIDMFINSLCDVAGVM